MPESVPPPLPIEGLEITKLQAARKKGSEQIGEFLDNMRHEFGWVLCERHSHDDGCFSPEDGRLKRCGLREGELVPVQLGIQQILAQYFGINLQKLAAEQDAVLADIRARQQGRK